MYPKDFGWKRVGRLMNPNLEYLRKNFVRPKFIIFALILIQLIAYFTFVTFNFSNNPSHCGMPMLAFTILIFLIHTVLIILINLAWVLAYFLKYKELKLKIGMVALIINNSAVGFWLIMFLFFFAGMIFR